MNHLARNIHFPMLRKFYIPNTCLAARSASGCRLFLSVRSNCVTENQTVKHFTLTDVYHFWDQVSYKADDIYIAYDNAKIV